MDTKTAVNFTFQEQFGKQIHARVSFSMASKYYESDARVLFEVFEKPRSVYYS